MFFKKMKHTLPYIKYEGVLQIQINLANNPNTLCQYQIQEHIQRGNDRGHETHF